MNLRLSTGPHIHTPHDTQDIMRNVLIALIPSVAAGIYLYGARAALLIAISTAVCVLSEYLWQLLMKKPIRIRDLSAAVTGVILGLNLSSNAPWWIPVVGGVFAIIVVKQLFGGIGHNFLNPAMTARAVLLVSWPGIMTSFLLPTRTFFTGVDMVDAYTGATPLASMIELGTKRVGTTEWSALDLFLGNIPGTIGETCKAAILLGLLFLLVTGVIKWHIPVFFTGSVALFSWMFGMDPLLSVLSGGVLFGAVFMATDYVTNPMLVKGRIIYAIGCGLIVTLIRRFGGYPEGVTFAILMMNVLTPLIDRATKRRIYGEVKKNV